MAAKKRALITGITGQDGSYLAELLLDKGYEVFGVVRRLSAPNVWRIQHLLDKVTLLQADMLDQLSLIKAVDVSQPDEFYNLAAMSFVPASWDQPMLTGEFNAQGVTCQETISASQIPQPVRSCCDTETADKPNMRLASTAPAHAPMTCTAM